MKNTKIFASAVFTALVTAVGCGTDNSNHPHHGEDESQHGGHHGVRVSNKLSADSITYENEKHIANLHQYTFGGDNAEAYWSFASDALVFQLQTLKVAFNVTKYSS